MKISARFLLIIIVLNYLLLLIYGCQSVNEVDQTSPGIEASSSIGKITPLPTLVSSPHLETATPLSAREVVSPTNPVAITEVAVTTEATATRPISEIVMGRLFFARYEYYGWFDLLALDSPQGLVLDESNKYHKHTSIELVNGPGQSAYHVFSHYSDHVAFWTATTPGTLWISDAAYQAPSRVLVDTEERYVSAGMELTPWGDIALVWSPDDLHLFIYNLREPSLSRVYHRQTEELDEWFWNCDSLILSSQSHQLATLCTRMEETVLTKSAYAVIEWGGEIWFSETLPGELFLEPLADGTVFWQWSADGKRVAYFDPQDIEGYLLIADLQGNKRKLLPGISPFRNSEIQGYQQYEFLRGDIPFRWARNASVLLINGLGQFEQLCPSLVSEEFGPRKSFTWHCWQAVDVDTASVIWSEAELAHSLSLVEAEEEPISLGISDLAVAPNGRAIVIYTTYLEPRIVFVDLQTAQATTISIFDRFRRIYWGADG